jgi:hypothetical protein
VHQISSTCLIWNTVSMQQLNTKQRDYMFTNSWSLFYLWTNTRKHLKFTHLSRLSGKNLQWFELKGSHPKLWYVIIMMLLLFFPFLFTLSFIWIHCVLLNIYFFPSSLFFFVILVSFSFYLKINSFEHTAITKY